MTVTASDECSKKYIESFFASRRAMGAGGHFFSSLLISHISFDIISLSDFYIYPTYSYYSY